MKYENIRWKDCKPGMLVHTVDYGKRCKVPFGTVKSVDDTVYVVSITIVDQNGKEIKMHYDKSYGIEETKLFIEHEDTWEPTWKDFEEPQEKPLTILQKISKYFKELFTW